MAKPMGKAVVAQSGGPTAVINASACGVIQAALDQPGTFTGVYGALNGILGVLREELYDLARDPDEQLNLAADPEHADRLREMRALLRQHMVETRDPSLGAPFTNDY